MKRTGVSLGLGRRVSVIVWAVSEKSQQKTTRVRRVAVGVEGEKTLSALQGGGEVDDPEAAHDEH